MVLVCANGGWPLPDGEKKNLCEQLCMIKICLQFYGWLFYTETDMSITCGCSHSQHFVTDNPAWAWDQAPQHSHNWHKTLFPDSSVVHLQRGCIQTAHHPQSVMSHTGVPQLPVKTEKWQHCKVLATPLHSQLVTTCSPPHCLRHKYSHTLLVITCSHPHCLTHMYSNTVTHCFSDCDNMQSSTLTDKQTCIATHAVICTAWHTITDTHCLLVSNETTYSHPHYLIYTSIATHSLPQPWRSTPCLQQIVSNVKWILLKNSTLLREVKRNLNDEHGGFKLRERWQTACLLILPQQ